MNTPKKSAVINNGWILCPSKTFPGKFYYFNVVSGEAVWSLNNNEKTTLKKENCTNIQNINNRYHSYPEPTTPPDNSPNITPNNSIWPNTPTSNRWSRYKGSIFPNEVFAHQSPNTNINFSQGTQITLNNDIFSQNTATFGQPAHFGTNPGQLIPSVGKVGMPSFVWTPKHVPMSGWLCLSDNKPALDRVVETSQIERDLFVHTNGVPLSQKFINYEKPSLYFNEEYRPKYFGSSTPMIKSNFKMELVQNQVPKSKSFPEQILNMETELQINDVTGKSTIYNSDKVEIISDTVSYGKDEETAVDPRRKITFPNQELVMDESETEKTKTLHKSDLRLLLMAKRKLLHEEKLNEPIEKKPKIEELPGTKKVSFNVKTGDTFVSNHFEQEKCHQHIPTTNYNTSFNKIPVLPTQTSFNYHHKSENKNPMTFNNRDSNILRRNLSRYNIPAKNMATHNVHATNYPNNMTRKHYNTRTFNKRTPYTINNMSVNKPHTMNMCQTNIPTRNNTQNYSPTVILEGTSKSMPQHDMPNKNITKSISPKSTANNCPVLGTSATVKSVWYLVVDIDVLLEDLQLIDRLLQSDEKCRLIIPHGARTQLEELCVGDCKGQQRVLAARQLIRRISVPQTQYVVEPPPAYEKTNVNSGTDYILDSCVRLLKNQHCVMLITNNPYLKGRASALNIRCYNTEEIQNGAIHQPKLFSELKKIKVIVDNEGTNKNNIVIQTQEPDNIPVMYKNQLLVKDKRIEKNCDILINITKPKTDQHISKYDQLEINNRVQKLNIKDSANNNEIDNLPPILTHNINEANSSDMVISLNKNTSVPHMYNFENLAAHNQLSRTHNVKNVPNTKSDNNNKEIIKPPKFQQNNPLSSKNILISTQKENNLLLHVTDRVEKYPIPDNKDNTFHDAEVNTVTTAARHRIEKIISCVNTNTNKDIPNEDCNLNLKSFDEFKIPKLIPFKKGRTITSSFNDSYKTTDSIRSNFENSDQSLEGSLKKFFVNSKMMHDKLTVKMDEWICNYTQIMEHLISDILQNNSGYLKQMDVSNTNLHDLLMHIKMLYDDTKLRDISGVLMDLLKKCTCNKGKIKPDTSPKDFMKMIGCGVLLVRALKTILPDLEVLTDYESFFNSLIANIESRAVDLDPELLRPIAVCRSEIDDKHKEDRCNFSKKPSMIIEYLKKHYKAWSSYDEEQDGDSGQFNTSPNGDNTVVRLSGKNTNMLKIDNDKSLSYIDVPKDSNAISQKEAETKLIRLLSDKQTNQDVNPIQGEDTRLLLKRATFNPRSIDVHEKITEDNHLIPNTKSKVIRFIDYNKDKANQYTCFKGNKNTETMKTIGEYETSMKNKEPLHYSEINAYTAKATLQNLDQCDFSNDYFGDEFYKFGSNNSSFIPIFETNNLDNNFNGKDTMDNKDIEGTESSDINNDTSAKRRQDNFTIFKESLIGIEDYTKKGYKMVATSVDDKKDKENLDNSTSDNRYIKNNPRDDSTNDSGFENETSQAYTLVKIFFNELGNTFKDLYKFIIDFVKEIREEVLCEERMSLLHSKSSRRLEAVRDIINHLKCIVERESAEDTPLKTTLFGSGAQSPTDTKIIRYRELVEKCLEQAEVLQGALKIIVCITIGDLDALSTSAGSIASSAKYSII